MKPRILFVDDEAPMREMLSSYFRTKGCEVATAMTGREAKELATCQTFDVAILDIKLAGENGLELLGHFKKSFPQIPIVMFTGMADDDVLLDQAMARGASGFMRKTDPLDDLFASLQPYLPRP